MDNIQDLKAEIARLKSIVEDQRDAIRRLTEEVKTHEAKEQSISSAIVFAVERSNQLDNSMHKLYELNIQRSRLLYARMERVLNELYNKYPDLKKEPKLKDMAEKFKSAAYGNDEDIKTQAINHVNSTGEDPIKKLLKNIIGYIDDKKPVRQLSRNKALPSALDAIASDYALTPSKSGFDINEALNPTEDLEDILKSFNLKRKVK